MKNKKEFKYDAKYCYKTALKYGYIGKLMTGINGHLPGYSKISKCVLKKLISKPCLN